MSRKRRKDRVPAGRPKDLPPPESLDQPYRHQTWLFLLLMFVSIGMRLWLLMVSRHYLSSDEAVTAMETLDILDGDPIPFFLYGQLYGGGHTVVALMALPLFAIFGPADYLFKIGPAMLSCVYILVVYLCLYQFVAKKHALIAAAVFSFFATFVAFNFDFTGEMIMSFFGWLGLYFFFHSYFAEKERPLFIILSGAATGFAYYCFDYGLYYLFAVIMLWALKENIRLWRRWRSILVLMLGFFIGASPLIYYNLTHDFANIRLLFARAVEPDPTPLLSALMRFAGLLYHDLPAFFSLDIDDFPPEISLVSYLSYALFVISALYIVAQMRAPILSLMRSFFTGRIAVLPPEHRVAYFLLLMILYFALYSLASVGGKAARYLVILCPFIAIVLAWPVYHLGRRHLVPAVALVSCFGAFQIYFLAQLARDNTTVEWRIVTHGEDMKALSKFLLDNNLTTVVTPYEIKWKLMFESRRKIVAAAYMFGFDREEKYNLEVIDRVNRKGMPLAIVFDKEYKFPQIALQFNPEAAFDLAGFHEFLKRNDILYQITSVGQDYIVYHGFSKRFPLPDPSKAADTQPR